MFVAMLLQTLSAGADSCPIVTFSCPPLPPITEPAKDVYSLRPQDIKVVMSLGDSVTAGAFRCARGGGGGGGGGGGISGAPPLIRTVLQ